MNIQEVEPHGRSLSRGHCDRQGGSGTLPVPALFGLGTGPLSLQVLPLACADACHPRQRPDPASPSTPPSILDFEVPKLSAHFTSCRVRASVMVTEGGLPSHPSSLLPEDRYETHSTPLNPPTSLGKAPFWAEALSSLAWASPLPSTGPGRRETWGLPQVRTGLHRLPLHHPEGTRSAESPPMEQLVNCCWVLLNTGVTTETSGHAGCWVTFRDLSPDPAVNIRLIRAQPSSFTIVGFCFGARY